MTGLFDARDSGDLARRNAAPGPPATIGESALSAAESFKANIASMGEFDELFDEYDKYLDGVSAATGRQFDNPYADAAQPDDFIATVDPNTPRVLGFMPPQRPKSGRQREKELFAELQSLRDEVPGLQIRSPEDIRKSVVQTRAQARERRADVAAREGTAGAIAAFATTAVASLLDPPVLASMAFGAPAATGILRAAAIDAGIAAGVEVPIQAIVQASRRRLGEQTSLSEAAINVLTVGAGGFLFSGLLRGGARGTKALVKAARFRRIEQRMRRQTGQSFFAPPGKGFPPRRAPDLGKAVGGVN